MMNDGTTKALSNGPPQQILVIDDEEDYRAMIAAALKMMGYAVLEATSGVDGLAAIKKHHPDLVLCDVNMPQMDGYTMLSTLKDEPEFSLIPFIFLTGKAAKSDMRQGMQLGADDYLTKPFTTEELVTAVAARLSRITSIQKFYASQFDDIKTSIVRFLPHEFRTPMNAILGFSQYLSEENDLPSEEVKEIGTLMLNSGQRLFHLLENMILYGQLQLWMNDQDTISAMRRESMTSLREAIQLAAEQQAALHKRADSISIALKEASVQISAMHLTKITEEIINNALKFSELGTKIYISSEETETEVQLIVRDEGRGMSPEQIEKITGFQQFERRYYEQQGAGLGLVIAKMLTELYGGLLTIESREKIGTTVKIKLLKALKA